jgi:hypothetical protein
METAALVITSLIAIVGLYLAHSLRRQQTLRIAEERTNAYRELWELMELARPTRLAAGERGGDLAGEGDDGLRGAGPLTRAEASSLYRSMTHWYFHTGNGMLLSEVTKELYLEAKRRLGTYAVGGGHDWEREGARRIDELSLLRTQMKSDLAIYGTPYFGKPDMDDEDFLRAAHVDPDRWARPPLHQRVVRFLDGGGRRPRTESGSASGAGSDDSAPGSAR